MDTLAKEEAIAARLEKDREHVKERVSHHAMSRTSSKNASQRGDLRTGHTSAAAPSAPTSPKASDPELKAINPNASVRATFSFANAAANKKDASEGESKETTTEEVMEKIAEVQI